MSKFLPYARLALLAGLTSLTLTSCFDKKCDPKPKPTVCTGLHTSPSGGTSGGSN